MILSKVIRRHKVRITRAHYDDRRPMLGHENVIFPKFNTIEARALRRLLPVGRTLSHREFYISCHSYRLGAYIGFLRDKGWTIVDHDREIAVTGNMVQSKTTHVRYELFADFSPEFIEAIYYFCVLVDDYEARAAATAQTKKSMSCSGKNISTQL